jgi:hypothetical protein
MKSLWIVVLGVVVVLVAGGCDHKLKLTVNNTTPETRDVVVGVGGQHPRNVGVVLAHGTVTRTIKIPKDELPTELRWRCGGLQGVEPISSKQKKVVIFIDRESAVVTDGKSEIEHRTNSQTIIDVRSTTLVE